MTIIKNGTVVTADLTYKSDIRVENGVITDWFLFCDNAMRIAPPLIITDEQIRQACAVILEAVDYVAGR